MALVLALALALTGCATSDYQIADGVGEKDLVGTWVVRDSPTDATLNLRSDGSLEATGWPSDLVCATEMPEKLADIDWNSASVRSGSWEKETHLDSTLTLTFDGASCPFGTPILQGEAGLYVIFFLGRDPDTSVENVIIDKASSD